VQPNMRDYDETYASFNWERPERYNFARDVIDARAHMTPVAQALLCVSKDGTEEYVEPTQKLYLIDNAMERD